MKTNRFSVIFSIIAILLLVGATSAVWSIRNPDEWKALMVKGLERIATYKQTVDGLNATEAASIYRGWSGKTISWNVPNENMWKQYCQNIYVEVGGYCGGASEQTKIEIMNRMRICTIR